MRVQIFLPVDAFNHRSAYADDFLRNCFFLGDWVLDLGDGSVQRLFRIANKASQHIQAIVTFLCALVRPEPLHMVLNVDVVSGCAATVFALAADCQAELGCL